MPPRRAPRPEAPAQPPAAPAPPAYVALGAISHTSLDGLHTDLEAGDAVPAHFTDDDLAGLLKVGAIRPA